MFYHASSKKNGACYFQVKFLNHLHKDQGETNNVCFTIAHCFGVVNDVMLAPKLGRRNFRKHPITFLEVAAAGANSKRKVLRCVRTEQVPDFSISSSFHCDPKVSNNKISHHNFAPFPFDSSTCSNTCHEFQPKGSSLRVYVYYPEESRPLPIE